MTRRLLKVVVQPVFVEDYGDALGSEILADPIVVAAADWESFAQQFPEAVRQACSTGADAENAPPPADVRTAVSADVAVADQPGFTQPVPGSRKVPENNRRTR